MRSFEIVDGEIRATGDHPVERQGIRSPVPGAGGPARGPGRRAAVSPVAVCRGSRRAAAAGRRPGRSWGRGLRALHCHGALHCFCVTAHDRDVRSVAARGTDCGHRGGRRARSPRPAALTAPRAQARAHPRCSAAARAARRRPARPAPSRPPRSRRAASAGDAMSTNDACFRL